MASLKELPLTAKQKEQLIALGFNEEDIDNSTLIDVTLYKQALGGNVKALTEVKKMLEAKKEEPEGNVKDITNEVKKEEKKLLKSLDKLPKELIDANKELIHNVAFQSVELRYLTEDIAKNGVKEKYMNGANQWGWKDRAEVKTYNAMIKSYQSCMKQINDLLIANGYGDINDEFDEFNK